MIVPYIIANATLDIRVLEMTGSNPTSNDFVQTYTNALPVDESYKKEYPMDNGVILVTTLTH